MKYVVAVFFLASGLAAQSMQARITAGVTSFADEGPVNHFSVGGAVRFYFSRRWSVEPEYLHARTGNRHYDNILWGNVTFDFRDRDRPVVPYWFAAPGLVRSTDAFGRGSFSSTEGAFATGAGVRFFLSDRVFVAPQFRIGVANGVFAETTGSLGFVVK